VIPDPDAAIQYGTKIGRFMVVGELGAGGMGVVYSAHDRELDRKVALKVLRAAAATDEERVRMLREGQAMARITHPNVITVYEVGVEGSLVFLAQELLDGGTLGRWLEKQRTQQEIVDKFVAAGRGLAAAHAAGLVHRDFKPDNVLLGKDGRVRVSDFGLARALGPVDEGLPQVTRANIARAQLELSRSPMSPLTRTGAVMGTPMYMAPEQHLGDRTDERTDQFSFAVALYHALYGDWPFSAKTAVALADNVIEGRMQKPPRGRHVPERLRRIVLRALRTKPAERYPSIGAMLEELVRPPSRTFRKLVLAAAVLVLAAGAVIGGYALRTREQTTERPAVDPKMLTTDHGVAWLSTALERGQLQDAAEKYEMAGALAKQSGDQVQASIAWSAGAFVHVLRGHLDDARQRLRDAETNAGGDPIALGYSDLAAAAVASAGGDLTTALDRGARCARALKQTIPVLGTMCLQLRGAAAAQKGDVMTARDAYAEAIAIAKRIADAPRELELQLAIAELDLDDGQQDQAAELAATLQPVAAKRGAASAEAHAWVLLARAHLAQAQSQQALADLGHINDETLEPFQFRIEHQIALGQTNALLGDPDEARKHLDAAVTAAGQQGYIGLVLEAKLAQVEVAVATAAPDAKAEQRALVDDARRRGYGRIATLAATVGER
jgi:tetratricopeptide (TPR) repeat protein